MRKHSFLFVLLSLVTFNLFATEYCPPSVSGTCYNDFRAITSRANALRTCDNVADHCYRDIKRESRADIDTAADSCLNVSASCYTALKREGHSSSFARLKCENIASNCFTRNYNNGLSALKSAQACSDQVNCDYCSY